MASSRYTSYDTRSSTSSFFSDPSSSVELNFKSSASRAIVKSKHSDVVKVKSKPSDQNLTAMVKKFMGSKPKTGNHTPLVIPADFIAEDLKKNARKGSNFGGLHKKIFGKGTASSEMKEREAKALTEVKSNTRTLAMVLRSERELLSLNKSQEVEISELKLTLQEKTREVEKLKDLCLNQREEIKALKDAILFPDVMNSQLQELLEKQGSELKQAKHVIPTLQRQVTSLTGQLQSLADDLAEVKKADKYGGKTLFQCNGSSTRTPSFDDEDSSKSLDLISCDPASPGSPADMFINDFNPCLTPHTAKSKSKEYEARSHDYPVEERLSRKKKEIDFYSYTTKLSKSSESNNKSNTKHSGNGMAARRSGGTKNASGKQMHHKLY